MLRRSSVHPRVHWISIIPWGMKQLHMFDLFAGEHLGLSFCVSDTAYQLATFGFDLVRHVCNRLAKRVAHGKVLVVVFEHFEMYVLSNLSFHDLGFTVYIGATIDDRVARRDAISLIRHGLSIVRL